MTRTNKPAQAPLPEVMLTPQERLILEKTYAYDGVLGFSHIQRILGLSRAQTYTLIKQLVDHGLLAQASSEQRRNQASVYWLTPSGAYWIAVHQGVALNDLSWREAPRWSTLDHDFSVTDFRLNVVEACEANPNLMLQEWTPERVFRIEPDRIEFVTRTGTRTKRSIIPDGYFIIRVLGEERDTLKRYFLEADRASEDNPRFADEKVLALTAYISSQEHEHRFGVKNKGHVLVVTTGIRRMQNMLAHAQRLEGKRFLFTTFDQVSPETVLTKPIWYLVNRPDPVALVDMSER